MGSSGRVDGVELPGTGQALELVVPAILAMSTPETLLVCSWLPKRSPAEPAILSAWAPGADSSGTRWLAGGSVAIARPALQS